MGNDGVVNFDFLGAVKFDFKHIKRNINLIGWVGRFGAPIGATDSSFFKSNSYAFSGTTTRGGKAACNSITDCPTGEASGGGIVVNAKPETKDIGCKYKIEAGVFMMVGNNGMTKTANGGAEGVAKLIEKYKEIKFF